MCTLLLRQHAFWTTSAIRKGVNDFSLTCQVSVLDHDLFAVVSGSMEILEKEKGGVLTLINLASNQELSIAAPAARALAALASRHGHIAHNRVMFGSLTVKGGEAGLIELGIIKPFVSLACSHHTALCESAAKVRTDRSSLTAQSSTLQ